MSLGADLAAAAEAARRHRPPARQMVLENALAALRLLGVVERALGAGEMAPEFELPDAAGLRFALTQALDRGPAVLVFYRGTWCPYCRLTLAAFEAARPAIEAAGASLAVVSAEPPTVQTALGPLSLRRLFDHDNRVARLFDLVYAMPEPLIAYYRLARLEVASLGSSGRWELALPATYVIGRDGIVRFAQVEADFTRRAGPDEVLAALAKL